MNKLERWVYNKMAGTMRAAVKVKGEYNGTEIKAMPIPKLGPRDVLIKVRMASICGSDVHIYKWDSWASSTIVLPRIYGHEYSGYIVALGEDVKGYEIDDYVSGEGHIGCGRCYNCRTGNTHICSNLISIGVDKDGAFAEYIAIPMDNVWKNDPSLPPDICSIQDPLGNAVHTVFATDIPGRRVVIMGIGPIGAMAVAICKHIGAEKIFAVDYKNEYRLKMARDLGATVVLDAATDDIVDHIIDSTDGMGVDVVLEMSGASSALKNALRVLRPGGTLAVLGLYKEKVNIDMNNDIVLKSVTVKGIFGRRMFDTWYRMNGLLKNPSFLRDIKSIITHRFGFEEFHEAMETAVGGNSGKVVIDMED